VPGPKKRERGPSSNCNTTPGHTIEGEESLRGLGKESSLKHYGEKKLPTTTASGPGKQKGPFMRTMLFIGIRKKKAYPIQEEGEGKGRVLKGCLYPGGLFCKNGKKELAERGRSVPGPLLRIF